MSLLFDSKGHENSHRNLMAKSAQRRCVEKKYGKRTLRQKRIKMNKNCAEKFSRTHFLVDEVP